MSGGGLATRPGAVVERPGTMTDAESYRARFERLTGRAPYPYQVELATGSWPEVLDVPTGLGKTAAVVVAWLHRRLEGDASTGRRLVYCLPMRTLVEQTAREAERWCERARPEFEAQGRPAPEVHMLLGGHVDERWERTPEREAVLVGTQDQLLSRALNRGFAMSRYRWPLHFAWLSNDCLWVYDETQLMGVGIETSAQLAGLTSSMGAIGPRHALWVSATVGRGQLDTVDHPAPAAGFATRQLSEADRDRCADRLGAAKPVARSAVQLTATTKDPEYAARVADLALGAHRERGGLTLVVVNRVARAQAIFAALETAAEGEVALGLVHSRFRPRDRARAQRLLTEVQDARIVVATQAVEAGVDVSAKTLITELAPWPSLVQRIGRCNRYGEQSDAAVSWIDLDTADPKAAIGIALPYEPGELDEARRRIASLVDAGPAQLRGVAYEPPAVVRPVLRRRDLLDLFDTTPDLAGRDLDVGRFVRDGEDLDVPVFWRVFEGDTPPDDEPPPARDELCGVSLAAFRGFLDQLGKRRKKAKNDPRLRPFGWDALRERWAPVDRARPGQPVLLAPEAGGYEPGRGWTGEPTVVEPVQTEMAAAESDAMAGDTDSRIGRWVELADHLAHVAGEAFSLAAQLGLTDEADSLRTAGAWHDVGKAHDEFQTRLAVPDDMRDRLWAKSATGRGPRGKRVGFRHELASALAWLAATDETTPERDLIAYLVAAHHGKVRMSIRSLPDERSPPDPERAFARGVWDGDSLRSVRLPSGEETGERELDLSVLRMGLGSWLERTLALRDRLGPFRLAYLESLVRVADWTASAKEQEGGY